MNQDARKQVLRSLPYGLYAFGVRAPDGTAHFATVSWVTQVSFEPPLVVLALELESRSLALLRAAGCFALGVLPSGARQLAGRLGRSSSVVPDKSAGVRQHPGPVTDAPILEEATGWLECRVAAEHPAGDHVVVLAEVIEAGLQAAGETLTLRETGFRYAG